MDFVPENPEDKESIFKLLSGKNVPGIVRIKRNDSPEFAILVRDTFKPELNLYYNNCYHFAWHFFVKSLDWMS